MFQHLKNSISPEKVILGIIPLAKLCLARRIASFPDPPFLKSWNIGTERSKSMKTLRKTCSNSILFLEQLLEHGTELFSLTTQKSEFKIHFVDFKK